MEQVLDAGHPLVQLLAAEAPAPDQVGEVDPLDQGRDRQAEIGRVRQPGGAAGPERRPDDLDELPLAQPPQPRVHRLAAAQSLQPRDGARRREGDDGQQEEQRQVGRPPAQLGGARRGVAPARPGHRLASPEPDGPAPSSPPVDPSGGGSGAVSKRGA